MSTIVVAQENKKPKTLIVFFDGLRPDYITPEYMPNLSGMKQNGSYGSHHHSVFPTVTRVNSASYATGAYPGTHGLLGNSVYFPEIDKTKGFDAGDAQNLIQITEATNDKLLTSISFGEVLKESGINFMVFSSGSTGQAMLQNHKINGGAVINPELILPESMKEEVEKTIGAPPDNGSPNTGRHKWAVDALLHYGLKKDGPQVNAIWMSDPDGTAHREGIGSPLAMESIKIVDAEFGRIISHLKEIGQFENTNILISTDHGFVTYVGKDNLTEFLIKEGFKKDIESEDVVVVGNAVYVKNHDQKTIESIIASLHEQEWIGALFTKSKKSGDFKGNVNGTLSFESIHWDHPRSADIVVDVNWDERENAYGFKGASYSKGVAGHGSSSRFEINIPFIAYGPSFKSSFTSSLPTSNVDIVPTILDLYGIKVPAQMDGRPMKEFFSGDSVKEKNAKKTVTKTSATYNWGTYILTLEESILGNYRYVDFTKTERVPASLVQKNKL
ncbi:MAG: alkaline phosphatase family protein [Bacteroidota bacterium]|nr:alkaline phosphatase family protein [Bacteroidota bacterium]